MNTLKTMVGYCVILLLAAALIILPAAANHIICTYGPPWMYVTFGDGDKIATMGAGLSVILLWVFLVFLLMIAFDVTRELEKRGGA